MLIIGLLILSLVLAAFIMRGAPSPQNNRAPDAPPAEITHPWSSGRPDETDDFAGPTGIYGPGTSEPNEGP